MQSDSSWAKCRKKIRTIKTNNNRSIYSKHYGTLLDTTTETKINVCFGCFSPFASLPLREDFFWHRDWKSLGTFITLVLSLASFIPPCRFSWMKNALNFLWNRKLKKSFLQLTYRVSLYFSYFSKNCTVTILWMLNKYWY